MDIGKLIRISIAAIFINNYIFSRFLGICPFVGVSKKLIVLLVWGLQSFL